MISVKTRYVIAALIGLVLLFVFSHGRRDPPVLVDSPDVRSARAVVDKLVYVKDEKSGLCFGWHQGAVNFLVNVPCNSKPFQEGPK